MSKKSDQRNMDLEREQAREAVKLCDCSHSKYQHLDWGNEGPCELGSCDCRKYKPGRPCNACGLEGFHPPEICISRLRGEASVLLDALKGIMHLALEMKGTKCLGKFERVAIETAKKAIREAESRKP